LLSIDGREAEALRGNTHPGRSSGYFLISDALRTAEESALPAWFARRARSAAGAAAAAAPTSALAAKAAASSRAKPAPAFRFGTGFIDGEGASAKFLAVEIRNSFCGRVIIGHLDEGKAPRLARVAVCHDPDLLDFTECTEQIPEFVFGSGKGKVPYKKVLH
jgi:hypothetical protein